ncbi:unnamed protein product [Diamesa hyperborea]
MSNYDQQFAYEFSDQPQNFEFQSFENYSYEQQPGYTNPPNNEYSQYGSPNPHQIQPNIFTPTAPSYEVNQFNNENPSEFDEPPLLDELEIYPTRIFEKSLAVLNPFHNKGIVNDAEYLFKENDLAGPIAFCLALAICLFLSGNKAQFGYIYGLSLITVVVMWILIKLMATPSTNNENFVTITSVASILGYSILPIVWLSVLGIFLTLNTKLGIVLAGISVFLSTAAASRIFCLMTGDQHQRYLIAYPCSLVYVIFVLLVLF